MTEHGIAQAALMADAARAGSDRPTGRGRFLRGDHFPSVVLAALVIALGVYAALANDRYLTEQNLSGMLALLAPLAFVALGQLVVVQAGGFDLSIGPLPGLLVVIGSFFFVAPLDGGSLALGVAAVAAGALAAGLVNGVMAGPAGVSPIVTTCSAARASSVGAGRSSARCWARC